jgi:hypothetical protein
MAIVDAVDHFAMKKSGQLFANRPTAFELPLLAQHQPSRIGGRFPVPGQTFGL